MNHFHERYKNHEVYEITCKVIEVIDGYTEVQAAVPPGFTIASNFRFGIIFKTITGQKVFMFTNSYDWNNTVYNKVGVWFKLTGTVFVNDLEKTQPNICIRDDAEIRQNQK